MSKRALFYRNMFTYRKRGGWFPRYTTGWTRSINGCVVFDSPDEAKEAMPDGCEVVMIRPVFDWCPCNLGGQMR